MWEQQAAASARKLEAGGKREEALIKKIEEARAQTQHYHKLSLESSGASQGSDAGSKETLQAMLHSRNKVVAHLRGKLSDMKEEVSNLKAHYTLQSNASKKEKDDLAHEVKCAQSQALPEA